MKDDDGSVASSAVPIPSGSSGDNESNEKRYIILRFHSELIDISFDFHLIFSHSLHLQG